MALTNVTVRTVEKDTTTHGGTEFKFYRTYEVPSIGTIMQWGSMRTGKSGGQFKHDPSTYTASGKIQDKKAEGYGKEHVTTIQVDVSRLQGRQPKIMGEILDNINSAGPTAFQPQPKANKPADPVSTDPAPSAPLPDRLAVLNKRALEAITLAATDPIAALTELSKITDDLESVEADVRKVRSYVGTLEVLTEEMV